MNQLSIYTLKALQKLYKKIYPVSPLTKPECIQDADVASKLIYNKLMENRPCMIARLGSTELGVMVNYVGVKRGKKTILKYIQGNEMDWWWNKNIIQQMQQWSGFFPPTIEKIEQFCELMLEDIKEVDILGSWLANERYFEKELTNLPKVRLTFLEPYWASIPWTKALQGKKVLVVHPFASTIQDQFKKRGYLFANPDVLPDFELKTIKAVQSLGGENNDYTDWFEALDYMKKEIDKTDFDICLIGCGAYGFSLAAHVKRQGKKAVHLGGALQLLFGIRGSRWENPTYGSATQKIAPQVNYYRLMNNPFWVSPVQSEKTKAAKKVENACYW